MQIRVRTSVAVLVLASVTLACPTEPEPEKPPCVGRLTGALNGTFTCDVRLAYDAASDTSTIQFDVTNFTGTALDLLLQGTTLEGPPSKERSRNRRPVSAPSTPRSAGPTTRRSCTSPPGTRGPSRTWGRSL